MKKLTLRLALILACTTLAPAAALARDASPRGKLKAATVETLSQWDTALETGLAVRAKVNPDAKTVTPGSAGGQSIAEEARKIRSNPGSGKNLKSFISSNRAPKADTDGRGKADDLESGKRASARDAAEKSRGKGKGKNK